MSADQPIHPKASALLAYLSGHIGRGNGVSAKEIARWIGWPERDVRKYVTELRERGHAVCAHPKEGYYIAETAEELEHACAFLHGRAMQSLKLIARLRKVSLPDLLGQLRMAT